MCRPEKRHLKESIEICAYPCVCMCEHVCVRVWLCVHMCDCVRVCMCKRVWGLWFGLGLVPSPGKLFGCLGLGWAGLEIWDGDGIKWRKFQLLLGLPILVVDTSIWFETSI